MTVPALALITAASGFLLPANPVAWAVGDAGDGGGAVIAILVVWPEWGSITEEVATAPGGASYEVLPAIERKRALFLLRAEPGRLEPAVEPRPVGGELLGLGSAGPGRPIVALTDEGPARLRLDARKGQPPAMRFEPIASFPPVVAGSGELFAGGNVVRRLGGRDVVLIPTATGLALVGLDGGVREIPALQRTVAAGSSGRFTMSLPRLTDADGDGTADAVENAVIGSRRVVRFRKGLQDLRFGPPVVWDVTAAFDAQEAASKPAARWERVVDVRDVDADGTLELLAVGGTEQTASGFTLKGTLQQVRGPRWALRAFALRRDGTVETAPERTIEGEGHFFYTRDRDGYWTPLPDLDGDRKSEILTFSLKIGLFGIARALVTKRGKAEARPHVYRDDGESYREVADAVPAVRLEQKLSNLDLGRFFRLGEDVDGDGLGDMIEVDRDRVLIRYARPGPRYGEQADVTIELAGPVRSWFGVLFRDVDGDGRSELLAFEPLEERGRRGEAPATPVRLEVRWLPPR